MNNKTTLAGLLAGGIPIITALITAYQTGAFTGKTGEQVAMGVAIIIFGIVSKDYNVTGGTKQQ